MLSAPHKIRRKRRRRKKPTVPSQSGSISPTVVPDELPSEPEIPDQPLYPKLSEEFLREEVEIETAMLLKRFGKESDLSKRKELEIAFFIGSIGPDETVNEHNDAEIEALREESMDILPTPSSIRTTYPYPEEGPKLASSYLHDDDATIIEPIQKQKVHFDEDLLFIPDLTLAKVAKDVESSVNGGWVRNIADEGIFVNEKPILSSRNLNQLINRFIEDNSLHWLTSDNTDIANMIQFVTGNRLFTSNCGKKIRPILFPITSVATSSAYVLQDKILKIQIQDIQFEEHPSYNAEQTIVRKIEKLYEEYASRRQSDIVGEIQAKLDVMRKLVTSTAQNHSDSLRPRRATTTASGDESASNRSHRSELRDLRNRLHREEKADRDIAQNLMKEWLALKEIREKQGNNRTALKLVIKTSNVNASDDERVWEYRFNFEFNEIFEEAMEFYREERRKQKEQARKQKDSPNFEPLQKVRRPDLDEIRRQLFDIYSNSVRPPGEQIVDFELDWRNGTVDTQKMKSATDLTKYVIRLLLDDKEVSSVKTTKMDRNGRVHLNELFSIKMVTKLPENMKIWVSLHTTYFYEYFQIFFLLINF